MRIASILIGPSAYEVRPGDPLPVSCKLQVIIILLCNLALFCSFLAAPLNATPGPATLGSSTRPVPVQGKQPSLVKSGKVHRQVNLEKFKEIRTDILEDASPCWVNALASVDTRTSNLVDHQDSELLRGYGLPDPLIFINLFKSDVVRFSKFLYVWLAIRAGWIAHITSQRQLQDGSGDVSRRFAQMPLPQHWKDYLIKVGRSVGVTFSAATTAAELSSTSEKKRDKKRAWEEKFVADLEDVFDLLLDLNGSLPDLFWQGTMVKLAAASDSIPPLLHIVREIIWAIVEDNWRLELLALDHCILSRRGMLQTDAGLRDEKVATCFPSSDLLVHVFPMWDASLGAQDSMN